MLRPYEFNQFDTSNHLYAYLDYLTKYVDVLEMSLIFKKKYFDDKLHLDISITDNEDIVFSYLFKVKDSNSYSNFDKSIFDELIYYVESKELTLNNISNDNFLILRLSRLHDFSENIAHHFKNKRMEYAKVKAQKKKTYKEFLDKILLAESYF